jgi:hypothetical protein
MPARPSQGALTIVAAEEGRGLRKQMRVTYLFAER